MKRLTTNSIGILFTLAFTLAAPPASAASECPYAGQVLKPEKLRELLHIDADGKRDRKIAAKDLPRMCGVHLFFADLKNWDLSWLDFENANFGMSDLSNANFNKSNLQGAQFTEATLTKTNFTSADLRGAYLGFSRASSGTIFNNAQLAGANFSGSEFKKTSFISADLSNAVLRGTVFENSNLLGANLRGANLTVVTFINTELASADFTGARMTNVISRYSDFERSIFREANLSHANFSGSHFDLAEFQGANLQGTQFSGATLTSVNLRDVNLEAANLERANLTRSDFRGANLQYATIDGANLSRVKLQNASLVGVSVQDLQTIERLQSDEFPTGLVSVRTKFKASGDRDAERYLTYLIKKNERSNAPALESAFSYILFEWPSDWGHSPGRPLKIIGVLIVVFTLFYAQAMLVPENKPYGVFRLWPDTKNRVTDLNTETPPQRIEFGSLCSPGLFLWAVYFSVLSAFHIGWRDLNVGNWILRLQTREFTLRPGGWVRTVSGMQSLISVYLLALWALTYFGRPFE